MRSTVSIPLNSKIPDFCRGIQYFGTPWPDFDTYGRLAVIREGETGVSDPAAGEAVFQTLLAADALRYLALQMTGTKASGHPGGFASSADIYAALLMLGYTNIITEAGHHAPGFYSAMFLDTSLEEIGITSVETLCERFRERHGLLGHLSGAIPGILAPAGPLGQGQHFAMAAALLHQGLLFPLTLGDGGMGEPYVLSSMMHFHTSYPEVTNFLPVLIWNGYSQEHHSMVSLLSNQQMVDYWKGHGFDEVILADAKCFDDQNQVGPYVDSTRFSHGQRMAFVREILVGVARAAEYAMKGKLTAFIVKQLKGAGMHAVGAKSHNLNAGDTLDKLHIIRAMKRRALNPEAWSIVRTNLRRAGGGPTSKTSVIDLVLKSAPVEPLTTHQFRLGEEQVPSTALGALVSEVGQKDPRFIVTNADGNEASGLKMVNRSLKIRHPTEDALYNQDPKGQVYEPLNEDSCAGLAAGVALFGGRSLWLSYESFALNGLPVWQTVTQAMAELRRKTPPTVALFTAGALEQGRNGWTHQRPEIENYVTAMMRNGNVYQLFPTDANMIQVAYEWALETCNKGIIITASKSPLPVFTTFDQGRRAIQEGAVTLYDGTGGEKGTVVLAVVGDLILLTAFQARDVLEQDGFRVRIVSVVNPRRLYRPSDIAWETVVCPDKTFMDQERFEALFDGDVLLGLSEGASAALEPVMLRSPVSRRDVFAWRRGVTAATTGELLKFNDLTAEALVARVRNLCEDR